MKNLLMALAAGLFLISTPRVLADDVEFHAVYTAKKQIQIVQTVPSPLTAGYVVLNNGAVVTAGSTVTLPGGRVFTLPKVIQGDMLIDVMPEVVELHAVYTPENKVQILQAIPTPLAPGFVVLNNGAVVTGGTSLTLPTGKVLTLPSDIQENMFIEIKD